MASKKEDRHINVNNQLLWEHAVEKENRLRLRWFRVNEARLEEIANKKNTRVVSEEVKEQMRQDRVDRFQHREVHGVAKVDDNLPPKFDQNMINNIMRPVEPEVTKLIYSSFKKDGRIKYLKERVKKIPEQRYYFPETTNFVYGWNMWDASKNMKASEFGRQQIIKESFYRRGGVGRDQWWYKEPAKLSPTVCGCTA